MKDDTKLLKVKETTEDWEEYTLENSQQDFSFSLSIVVILLRKSAKWNLTWTATKHEAT